jgi:hypothetical protein
MKDLKAESYASLHRRASREIDRRLLNQALAEIWDATHVADYYSKIHAYGSKSQMQDFAQGLRGVKVRPITEQEQHRLANYKRQAFRNP